MGWSRVLSNKESWRPWPRLVDEITRLREVLEIQGRGKAKDLNDLDFFQFETLEWFIEFWFHLIQPRSDCWAISIIFGEIAFYYSLYRANLSLHGTIIFYFSTKTRNFSPFFRSLLQDTVTLRRKRKMEKWWLFSTPFSAFRSCCSACRISETWWRPVLGNNRQCLITSNTGHWKMENLQKLRFVCHITYTWNI